MTKNPLVATPVVNKNGVATTVRKRTDTSTGARAATIPAPSVAKPIGPLPLREEIIGIIEFNLPEREKPMSQKVIDRINQLPEETAAAMLKRIREKGAWGLKLAYHIAMKDDQPDADLDTISVIHGPYIRAGLSALDDYRRFIGLVKGLHYCPQFAGVDDWLHADKETQQAARAVVAACVEVEAFKRTHRVSDEEEGIDAIHLEDPELTELIIEHSGDEEQLETLLDMISYQYDTDLMRAKIETASALRDGAI